MFCSIAYFLMGFDKPATHESVRETAFEGGNMSLCALSFRPHADSDDTLLPIGTRFFYFAASQALVAVTSAGLCMTVGAAAPSLNSANFVSVFLLLFLLLFCGLLINSDAVPVHLAWIFEAAPLKYAFEALAASAFGGQYFLFNPTTGKGGVFACTEIVGSQWLLQFGLDAERKDTDILAMIGFAAGYVGAAFVALKAVVRERR